MFVSVFSLPLLARAATTGRVVEFEIIAPATAKVNEAIDVTVRAIDSNKNVVPSYRWSVIFVPNNFGDEVPMQWRTIQFTAEDNGEKKFSKGVKFKSTGQQEIIVTESSNTGDDIMGETTVNVSAATTTEPLAQEEVSIISPENNTKITSDTVAISGNTRRNSKVNIKLNTVIVGTTISDTEGIFTKTISGITQQNNVLSVEVLDASNAVIGTSSNINIEKVDSSTGIFNATITPSTTVEESSPITITIETEPSMSTVNISLDGAVLPAKEGTAGKYTTTTVAPAKAGVYPIDVSVVNALGSTNTKTAVTQLTVIKASAPPEPIKVPAFKNVQALSSVWGKVTFTFGVENIPLELDTFKIVYGESADSFTEETITSPIEKIRGNDGLFHWYVDKLEPQTYYFKILGMRDDGTMIDALSSEPLNVTVGKDSCIIGNVGTVNVETLSDKSILSWEPVDNAVSYNIYKVAASGDQTLFQNVRDTKYVLFLSAWAIVYEDFAVKALCDSTTESATPALASRVQTGPASLAILVIVSGILGAFFLRRRVG